MIVCLPITAHAGDTCAKKHRRRCSELFFHFAILPGPLIAALSQAMMWLNTKQAMSKMASIYSSTFAYQKIEEGEIGKLQDACRPGGMQNRKPGS